MATDIHMYNVIYREPEKDISLSIRQIKQHITNTNLQGSTRRTGVKQSSKRIHYSKQGCALERGPFTALGTCPAPGLGAQPRPSIPQVLFSGPGWAGFPAQKNFICQPLSLDLATRVWHGTVQYLQYVWIIGHM